MRAENTRLALARTWLKLTTSSQAPDLKSCCAILSADCKVDGNLGPVTPVLRCFAQVSLNSRVLTPLLSACDAGLVWSKALQYLPLGIELAKVLNLQAMRWLHWSMIWLQQLEWVWGQCM